MAVSLGTGYVNVLPNLAGFRLRLSSGLKSALDEVDKIAASSSNNMSKSMGRLSIAGQAAFAGLGIAAGKFAISSIGAASDLNESLNKSVVVFGEASKSVIAFADNAAKIGLAKGVALDAAANFGAMAQAAGVATQASADMSIKLVGLAGDLASFNNVDPAEALEKLRAGLAGEARPLREFGVFISEARVKAEAYRLGIAKVGTELSDAQKIQARYNIILTDTTKQQGDFARTVGESLPNQLRVARAEFENLSASVGTALLPVATATLKVMTGFIDVFTGLPAPLKTAAVLTVALGGTLVGLGLVLKIVRASLGELGLGAGRAAVAEQALATTTVELAAAETAAGTATAGFAAKLGLVTKFIGPLVAGYVVFKTVTDAAGDSSKHAQQQLEGLTTAAKEHRINQDLLNHAIERYPALAFQGDIRRVQTALAAAGEATKATGGVTSDFAAASRDAGRNAGAAAGKVDLLATAASAAFDPLDAMRNAAGLTATVFRDATSAVAAFIHQSHELVHLTVPIPGRADPHAAGGVAGAGQLALVGERGPELLVPRVNSDVIPAGPTQQLLRGGRGDDLARAVRLMLSHTHPVEMDGYRVGRAQRMRALRESGR